MKVLALSPIEAPVGSLPPTSQALENLLSTTLGVMTVIGGLLFVLWIIIGAYNWITAEGKPDKLEKARKYIIEAVVGLVILVGAYALAGALGAALGLRIFDLSATLDQLSL